MGFDTTMKINKLAPRHSRTRSIESRLVAFGEFSRSVDLGAHRRSPTPFSPLAGAPQLWGPGPRGARGCTCPGAPGLRAGALAPGGGVDEPESRAPGNPVPGADTGEGAEDTRRVGAREPGFGPSRDDGSPSPGCLRKEASPGRSGRRRPGAAIGGLGEEGRQRSERAGWRRGRRTSSGKGLFLRQGWRMSCRRRVLRLQAAAGFALSARKVTLFIYLLRSASWVGPDRHPLDFGSSRPTSPAPTLPLRAAPRNTRTCLPPPRAPFLRPDPVRGGPSPGR